MEVGMESEDARGSPFAARRAPTRHPDGIDFFISWEGTQADRAHWVNEVLNEAGYSTYFYPIDNIDGNNYQERMTEAADKSRHILSLFSHAYFAEQGHAFGEALSALDWDPVGKLRRLLWVSFEEQIDAPSRFRTIVGLPLFGRPKDKWREALLEYARSALTGRNFGYTPHVLRGDEITLHDRIPRSWAAWISSSWDPHGDEPLPAVAERSFRVDRLWVRDRSPFRAVLADWPGADLPGALDTATDLLAGDGRPARTWHHLTSLQGREHAYSDRDSVLAALQPPTTSDAPLGVVVGITLTGDVDLRLAEDKAADSLRLLENLLRNDALILRVEGGKAQDAIWLAAGVAERLRADGTVIDLATRLRTTDRHQHEVGGAASSAVATVLALVRARRQALGAQVPWRAPNEAGAATSGADTATALVDELNDGAALPHGLDEKTILRHIRDNLPGTWPSLVREYAARRDVPGWYAGLEVVSEWPDDLQHWITTAVAGRDNPLHRPELLLGRVTSAVVDRVLLSLDGRGQLLRRWLDETDTATARAIRQGFDLPSLDGLEPDALRRVLRFRPRAITVAGPDTDPASTFRWISLTMGAELSIPDGTRVGVDVDEILSSAPPLGKDPVSAGLLDYYRRLVRPHGVAS
jgi:hypothetical protein